MIFKILCGILYCIGLLFGLTYKEISVYICIYICPIICIVSAFLINIAITYKLAIKVTFTKLLMLLISYLYIAFNFNFFAKICQHYSLGNLNDKFNQCVNDFQTIALNCNTTYEYSNIIIYVYLFFGIIIFNILCSYLIKKYL